MAKGFSDGGSRRTRREPPTMGKQLVNFITNKEATEPRVPFGKVEVANMTWLTIMEYLCHK
jgi:hypothetical protein